LYNTAMRYVWGATYEESLILSENKSCLTIWGIQSWDQQNLFNISGVRYDRVKLCSKCSFGTGMVICCNRLFVITKFHFKDDIKTRTFTAHKNLDADIILKFKLLSWKRKKVWHFIKNKTSFDVRKIKSRLNSMEKLIR